MHYLERELLDLVREDERIFQFLQDSSLDGLWYWDLDAPNHEWMSPSFWKLFGYCPEDMPHDPAAWQDMIHPEDLPVALQNFEEHCKDPDHPYDQVVRYKHKDGSEITVRCRGLAIRDDSGKPIRMLGAHNDLTGLVRSEAKLRAANVLLEEQVQIAKAASQAKTNFLANMSHEIRTPLNGVLGLASALELGGLNERQAALVEGITQAGAQLLSLIEEVLDISQIEAGTSSLNYANLEIAHVIAALSTIYRSRLDERQLELVVDRIPNLAGSVQGDKQRVRQVLENLIGNAIKFTQGGTIKLRSEVLEPHSDTPLLSVKVIDNGPGVPDSEKETIFDRFARGNMEGSATEGLGLGLSLSRQICRLHGGDLTLEDTPGGGASFEATFLLRASAAPKPKSESAAGQSELATLAPMSLLIAEDNALNQFVLESFLDGSGIALTFCSDGAAALQALEEAVFDAALIDMRMPVMDGMQFKSAYDARCIETGQSSIPMATYSANALPEQLAAYRDAGFDAHLTKPIAFRDLVSCLSTLKELCC